MKNTEPPRIATWMLEHLSPGNRNEALSGDLLEEFWNGRSGGWYWRQVLAAMATAYFRELRMRSLVVRLAVLWTLVAQVWWTFGLWAATHWAGFLVPWPYSTFVGGALVVFQTMWLGLAVYALICEREGFAWKQVGRAAWVGPLVFMLLTVAIQAVSHPLGIPIAARGLLKLVTYFLSLVIAAWGIRVRVTPESNVAGVQ